MKYFKDEQDFPFLKPFKDNFSMIRDEFLAFRNDKATERSFDQFAISTSGRMTLRSNSTDWKVIPFYLHYSTPLEIMIKYNVQPKNETAKEWKEKGPQTKPVHFARTMAFCANVMKQPNNPLINIFLSYYEPGTRVALHVNNDPYMYRAHLGLVVPRGNIGFKVCDETIKWKEGEFLVFAPTNPHTAWNLTGEGRVILIIDFLRPEEDQEEMRRMERAQFEKMIKADPGSFGMSGGYDPLSDDIRKRYAIPWVESKDEQVPAVAM